MFNPNLNPQSAPFVPQYAPPKGRQSQAAQKATVQIKENIQAAVGQAANTVGAANAAAITSGGIGGLLGAMAGASIGGLLGGVGHIKLPDNRVYEIKEGDTLTKIAKDSLGPQATPEQIQTFIDKIATLNADLIQDPNKIYTGDTIAVPVEKKASSKTVHCFVDD